MKNLERTEKNIKNSKDGANNDFNKKLAQIIKSRRRKLNNIDENALKVDCASQLFTLSRDKIKSKYKFTVAFTVIDIELLRLAVEKTLSDYPYFSLKLKKTWREHIFERNYSVFPINKTDDSDADFEKNLERNKNHEFPFAVKINGCEAVFEFEHYITDGTGGFVFVKSVIGYYEALIKSGVSALKDYTIDSVITDDAYYDYVKVVRDKRDRELMTGVSSYVYEKVRLNAEPVTLNREYDALAVKKAAKRYNTTVNTYIMAIALRAIIDLKGAKKCKRPYTLFTPVNARKIMGSETLKNYTYFTRIMIYKNNPSIEEIIYEIDAAMTEQLEKDSLQKKVSFSSIATRSNIFRNVPRVVKELAITANNCFVMPNKTTFVVSNMGKCDIESDIVDNIRFNSIGGYVSHVLSVITYKNKLNIGYQRLVAGDELVNEIDKALCSLSQ